MTHKKSNYFDYFKKNLKNSQGNDVHKESTNQVDSLPKNTLNLKIECLLFDLYNILIRTLILKNNQKYQKYFTDYFIIKSIKNLYRLFRIITLFNRKFFKKYCRKFYFKSFIV